MVNAMHARGHDEAAQPALDRHGEFDIRVMKFAAEKFPRIAIAKITARLPQTARAHLLLFCPAL